MESLLSDREPSIERGRNLAAKLCNANRREEPGEDVHGVMRAEYEDGCNLKHDDGYSCDSEPALAKPRQFDRTKNGDGCVPGEEKIVAHAVSDQQRRKSGIVPDHIRWRGERADGLHDLPQPEQKHKSQEWPNAGPEEPTPEQK